MALPDKHQLKFNIHKDAKSLMEAIEKRFGGNKETKKVQKTLLKQQYENFNGTSSESLDQIHARLQKLISQLEIHGESISQEDINMKFLRSLPSPQLDNEDLKQIDADDLEEMDLKWQMTMLTMRARRFPQRTGRNLGANGTTAIGFDMSKVECYNCHRRGHFARECRSPRDNRNQHTSRRTVLVEVSTSNALVSHCDGVGSYDWSFQADEEPTNYVLMEFTSSGSSRTGLGYDNQVFNSQVFDCDDMNSFESDDSVPTTPVHYSDAPPASETIPNVTSDSEDESEPKSVSNQKEPSFVQTTEHVKPPRASVKTNEHPKQAKNLRKDNQKSRGHQHSWNRKACFVCKSLNHLIKDYDYYKKQMVQKPVWNHAIRTLEFDRYAVLKELNMAYWDFLAWAPRLLYSRILHDL
nr:hypothetical protein [Tanacetum cinerariifolium]